MPGGGGNLRVPTATDEDYAAVSADYLKKRNYKETFNRAKFSAPARLLLEMNAYGKYERNRDGNYSYTKQVTNHRVINIEHLFVNYVYFESQPADWFDLFILMKQTKNTHAKAVKMSNSKAWTNTKAMMVSSGSRSGNYNRFVDFDKPEITSYLALYLLHSISPSTKIEMKLKSEQEDLVNGSFPCNEVFGKTGVNQHKEFYAFVSATNPIVHTPSTTTYSKWKIDPCLKRMIRLSKECMFIGRDISCDEQDIGYHGQHKDKQRITFKEVGDGFS